MTFAQLHQQEKPLLLGNVWNVKSAKLFEELNYQAIGTSSAAIADNLGIEDGENFSFEYYFNIIKDIMEAVKIPVSVDLEKGFGENAKEISENIISLSQIGIAGINLEDSIVRNGVRTLVSKETFSELLSDITDILESKKISIFLNIRTDVFLLNVDNALEEAKYRIEMYQNSKIDGIFLPGIVDKNYIREIVNFTSLPINVMCMPDLPDFNFLQEAAVKRISMGNFPHQSMYESLKIKTQEIITGNTFAPLLA